MAFTTKKKIMTGVAVLGSVASASSLDTQTITAETQEVSTQNNQVRDIVAEAVANTVVPTMDDLTAVFGVTGTRGNVLDTFEEFAEEAVVETEKNPTEKNATFSQLMIDALEDSDFRTSLQERQDKAWAPVVAPTVEVEAVAYEAPVVEVSAQTVEIPVVPVVAEAAVPQVENLVAEVAAPAVEAEVPQEVAPVVEEVAVEAAPQAEEAKVEAPVVEETKAVEAAPASEVAAPQVDVAAQQAEAERQAAEVAAAQQAEAERQAAEAAAAQQAQAQQVQAGSITPTYNYNTSGSYPVGQCTWGVKVMAPWVGDYWGNGGQWAANAAAAGFRTGTTPQVGAVASWNDGGYGHVAYVTDVQSENAIQVYEANYAGNQNIGNYRGTFDPTTAQGQVTYIYPN